MADQLYVIKDGIKIFDGINQDVKTTYERKISAMSSWVKEKLLTPLQPSTLTAQGIMSGVHFDERNLIEILPNPTGAILMIGCNYGELFNPEYKPVVKTKVSGRGRKPKPKKESKRKTQGNGKYFSSQITFLIRHPELNTDYKIKLFRNGVFQVPGVHNPTMLDLVLPVKILREYLTGVFTTEIQIMNFTAVMRNYKSKLLDDNLHVCLERLEEIIVKEKSPANYKHTIDYMSSPLLDRHRDAVRAMMKFYNPLNIAEMTYNTDRCSSLIIKFYRPSIADNGKKTTVKLLKKGKINFDGGNSQQEVDELYHWLEYIYTKYAAEILFDIHTITNSYASDTSSGTGESIYDSDSDDEPDSPVRTRDPGEIIAKAARPVIKKTVKKLPKSDIQLQLRKYPKLKLIPKSQPKFDKAN